MIIKLFWSGVIFNVIMNFWYSYPQVIAFYHLLLNNFIILTYKSRRMFFCLKGQDQWVEINFETTKYPTHTGNISLRRWQWPDKTPTGRQVKKKLQKRMQFLVGPTGFMKTCTRKKILYVLDLCSYTELFQKHIPIKTWEYVDEWLPKLQFRKGIWLVFCRLSQLWW